MNTTPSSSLISISNCNITNGSKILLPSISWQFNSGDTPLLLGDNLSQKHVFLLALQGTYQVTPINSSSLVDKTSKESNERHPLSSFYFNRFLSSTTPPPFIVSQDKAASLIEYEKTHDESDYLPGGLDIGRTPREFLSLDPTKISTILSDSSPKTSNPSTDNVSSLDAEESVSSSSFSSIINLCKIKPILDRGIKFLSTGEVRRLLLASAFLSKSPLLILSDIFSGLDASSRASIASYLDSLLLLQKEGKTPPHYIILSLESFFEVPANINRVTEFKENRIEFDGSRLTYQTSRPEKPLSLSTLRTFSTEVKALAAEIDSLMGYSSKINSTLPLVSMRHVNVSWGEHQVIKDLSWQVMTGQHFLITGPNGSGKTTLLELITGDNGQVYSNDISLFGNKRGSGETIWQIKHLQGIVSYKLHLEHRLLSSLSVLQIAVSGFHDSIGLYQTPTDLEVKAARKWLSLIGFSDKANCLFSSLSYGAQRAVLIIRACVKCPPILILDEPCSALDSSYRTLILSILETIARTSTTTLLHVTHEESEVLPCEHNVLTLLPNSSPMYRLSCR